MRASVCVCAGYLHHGECATKAMTDDIDELQRCLDAVHIPHSSPTLSVADLMSLQVTHCLSRRSHVSPGHTLSQSPTSCPYKSHTVSVADLMSLQVTHCHLLSLKDTHSLSRRPHVPTSHALSQSPTSCPSSPQRSAGDLMHATSCHSTDREKANRRRGP